MPTDSDLVAFLDHLPSDGSTIGNGILRKILGWSERRYDVVRQTLLDQDTVAKGRGRGGSVCIVTPHIYAGSTRRCSRSRAATGYHHNMHCIYTNFNAPSASMPDPLLGSALWLGDCIEFLESLPRKPIFDLIVTSPPYLVGKSYEKRMDITDYLIWQGRIFAACAARLKPTGSICWQVGTHVTGASRRTVIQPLDILLHPYFAASGATLRNRIVWQFGHGLHAHHRFSGRHETILWYTMSNRYVFDLDSVRVPQKYPGKRTYRPGPKHGDYSGHILGKNPSDVWMDIPNVKGNHLEKTNHPCQFPVALAERLIRSLSRRDALVFDPFAGVASTGVAAIRTGRRFWGCEIKRSYVMTGLGRMHQARAGTVPVRPLEQPIFDSTKAHGDLLVRQA